MPQQWKLPGPTAPYIIVWSYDKEAKESTRHVSAFSVCMSLDGWLRTRKQTLRAIYEALNGSSSLQLSGMSAEPNDALLKKGIADAFLSGRLVALTPADTPTPGAQDTKKDSTAPFMKKQPTGIFPVVKPSSNTQEKPGIPRNDLTQAGNGPFLMEMAPAPQTQGARKDSSTPTTTKQSTANAPVTKSSQSAQGTPGTPNAASDDSNYLPFTIKIYKGISDHEIVVRGYTKAFGLKGKEEAEALMARRPFKFTRGPLTEEQIKKGEMQVLISADLYEALIRLKLGDDPEKVNEDIKARRENLSRRSSSEQAAFREKVGKEFKNRFGRAPSKSMTPSEQTTWNAIQDDLLREEEDLARSYVKDVSIVGSAWDGRIPLEDLLPPWKTTTPLPTQKDLALASNADTGHLGIVVRDEQPMLRLRSSPSAQGNNVIGSLKFNTHVQIKKHLPGDWLHVGTMDGREGYVAANYVWFTPKHPLFEPNVRVHRVEKYNSTTGAGTAIAIAQKYYKIGRVQNLRFYVALLAVANRIPIPSSVSGWKEVKFQHGQLIWIPSQELADAMRGQINSGSYTYEILDALGIPDLVDAVGDFLGRTYQVLSDLIKAIWRSLRYLPEAIARHVEESLISVLTSLFEMAVQAMLVLAFCTAVGAAIGALFGGVGAAPGAAIGYKVGVAFLHWAGLVFLVQWIGDAMNRIGSAFITFLTSVWDARGDDAKIDKAAKDLAEAIGTIYGLVVEALVMWATAKGAAAALKALKGTTFERTFGESRLGSWLRERLKSKRTDKTPEKSNTPEPQKDTKGSSTKKTEPKAAENAGPQKTRDIDQLYRDAAVAQTELSALTKDVATQHGGSPVIPESLKGRARAQEKVKADYNGDASRLVDIARASIEFKTFSQIKMALEQIKARSKVVQIKDRFSKPLDGYRDMLIQLEMSNGHVVELQLHLEGILRVKNTIGHALYEQIRTIHARAKTEKRKLTQSELKKIDKLQEEMKNHYDKAFEEGN